MKKLVDVPDGRKVHKSPIPSLGGFGIFAGFILSLLVSVPISGINGLQFIAASAFIIYLLGLKDDVLIISPSKKFVGQLLAVSLLVFKGNIRLDSLYGILGIGHLPYVASVALSILCLILVINAFNLIDGVDGLAGTLGVISSLIFGIYFLMAHDVLFSVMAFSLVGGLAAFLIFNFTPARIFMGDTGSMLVGLINGVLVLHFVQVAANPTSVLPVASAPMIAFAILAVPLFDTLRVFAIRIVVHRRSPFSPDRNHIHHLLLDCGFSHPLISLVLGGFGLCIILAAFAFRFDGNYFLMSGIVLSSLCFAGVAAYRRQPPSKRMAILKNFALIYLRPASRNTPTLVETPALIETPETSLPAQRNAKQERVAPVAVLSLEDE